MDNNNDEATYVISFYIPKVRVFPRLIPVMEALLMMMGRAWDRNKPEPVRSNTVDSNSGEEAILEN